MGYRAERPRQTRSGTGGRARRQRGTREFCVREASEVLAVEPSSGRTRSERSIQRC